MQWLAGLALLPVLICGVMMGAMALAAVVGLRRTHGDTAVPPPPAPPPRRDHLEDAR